MKVGLVPCTKSKKYYPCPARIMYSASPIFRWTLKYALSTCDKVYILSAKHGLLELDDIINFYNVSFDESSIEERKEWAGKVLSDLRAKTSLENDEFLILVGKDYYEFLLEDIKNYEIPLKNSGIHDRIPKIKELMGINNAQSKKGIIPPILDVYRDKKKE